MKKKHRALLDFIDNMTDEVSDKYIEARTNKYENWGKFQYMDAYQNGMNAMAARVRSYIRSLNEKDCS